MTSYYEEKLMLKDLLPQLEEILQSHPEAEVTAYEGEGGAWVIVEGISYYKEFHTRSR